MKMFIEFVCEACHGKSRIDLDDPNHAEPLPGWRENLGQRAWIVTCPAAGSRVRSEVRLPEGEASG
jgi:hypothetical protein